MIRRALAVSLILLGGSSLLEAPSTAFAEPAPSGQPVFGYLDPKTDLFTPQEASSAPAVKSDAASPDATAAPVVREGKLVIVGTFSIDPSTPASTGFFASVTASASDAHYSCSVTGGGGVTRKGNSGKVTVTLPYACTVGSAADTVSIDFEVSASGSTGGLTISTTQTIPLPANGATTTVAIGERA